MIVCAKSRTTAVFSVREISSAECANIKSPSMTDAELLNIAFAVARPRREGDASITSSWTSVAVCSSSIDAASGTCRSGL